MKKAVRRRYGMPARGKAVILFIFLILLVLLFNMQVKPVIESVTANEAKIKAVNTINQVVANQLDENSVSYSDLITVSRADDGNVQAITTDIVKMNRLKAKIITDVQNNLGNDTYTSVGIPVGTLFGGDILHGRGPQVSLKITLSGNVTADFKSTFESAGINQTKHQIYLNVNASVYSFLPGFKTTTDINTNVLVAETIIVGSVPQVVANLK